MEKSSLNFYTTELNKQFAYINQLFANMPLSQKDKNNFLKYQHAQKIFALISLNKPALRESLINYSKLHSNKMALPVSRESQTFETILGNLENFKVQNKDESFADFIVFSKKGSESATFNLFSQSTESNTTVYNLDENTEVIRDFEKNISEEMSFSGKIWIAFQVFNKLYKTNGHAKKFSSIFFDYLYDNDAKKLINFPKIILDTIDSAEKTESKKRTLRMGTDEDYSKIKKEVFLNSALTSIKGTLNDLINFYKEKVDFESMPVSKKIASNYIIDTCFYLPEIIFENGFSRNNPLVQSLCEQTGFSKDDLEKEGCALLVELLESENFIKESASRDFEWEVNFSYSTTGRYNKWEKFNNIESIMIPTAVSEETSVIMSQATEQNHIDSEDQEKISQKSS